MGEIMRKNELGFLIGIVLVVIGLTILFIPYVMEKQEEKQEEKKVEDFIMNTSIKDNDDNEKDIQGDIEDNSSNSEQNENIEKNEKSSVDEDYIMILEIPKIDLKRGILRKESKYNNIEHNVTILKESNYPDDEKGNVYIAGHNGTARISYFNQLHRMEIGDIAILYYKGIKYTYKIDRIYDVLKDGDVEVERDKEKNTLTLVTCKKNTKDRHLVIILYLDSKEEY